MDNPPVLVDPIAIPLLGPDFARDMDRAQHRVARNFRAFMAARSRFVEDQLALAFERGVRQYVVLGAGLDTFAWRNPFAALRIFEVDFPATQEWKRGLLEEAGLANPGNLTFVPLDFEHKTLAAGLAEAGFDSTQAAFFGWLGVVPYLTLDAFRATIGFLSTLAPGTGLALDYGQPRAVLPPHEQLAHDSLAARVEQSGEPFQLFFTPAQIAAELSAFPSIEDIGREEINARYFADRRDQLQIRGHAGRLLSAWL